MPLSASPIRRAFAILYGVEDLQDLTELKASLQATGSVTP